MFIEGMTANELMYQFEKDRKGLFNYFNIFLKRNFFLVNKKLTELKKEKRETVVYSVEKQKINDNIYYIVFILGKKFPFLPIFFGTMEDSNGKRYLVQFSFVHLNDEQEEQEFKRPMIALYSYHIISRYRERSLKKSDLDIEKVIHSFLKEVCRVMGGMFEVKSDYSSNFNRNNNYSFVTKLKTGVIVGTKIGDLITYKTFISNDILKKDQMDVLEEQEKRETEWFFKNFIERKF